MIDNPIADNSCLSFIVFYAVFMTNKMLTNINKTVLSLCIPYFFN